MGCMSISRYSCQVLMNLGFSQYILEKYSNIKFHENPLGIIKGQKLSSGSLTTQANSLRQELSYNNYLTTSVRCAEFACVMTPKTERMTGNASFFCIVAVHING
jgi:hypothetical protein